jgi:hypothetical protein
MKYVLLFSSALLILATSASATVVSSGGTTGTPVETPSDPGDENAFDGTGYTGDLLEGLTATDVSGWFSTDRGPDKLVDGTVDGSSVANTAQNSGSSATATFDLGTGDNGLGYDLTSILSIAAWSNPGGHHWSIGYTDQWRSVCAGHGPAKSIRKQQQMALAGTRHHRNVNCCPRALHIRAARSELCRSPAAPTPLSG